MEWYDYGKIPDAEKEERGPLDNELDTPLSYHGFEQAFTTGKYILSELVKLGLEEAVVTFLSSPYTRCLQSTAGVHKGLATGSKTLKMNQKVTIHEELSEVSMYPHVHDEDPHPQ